MQAQLATVGAGIKPDGRLGLARGAESDGGPSRAFQGGTLGTGAGTGIPVNLASKYRKALEGRGVEARNARALALVLLEVINDSNGEQAA